MKLLKNLPGVAGKLKSGITKEVEYLSHVLQGLILITIFDEFCLVKLADKRQWIKVIMSRKHHRY